MDNPWKSISLSDYENHMSLDSVYQLQTMNQVMKDQFDRFPVTSVMIFGVAGGNGLEHIAPEKYEKIYGIDINPDYLEETRQRYVHLPGLECLCLDLAREADRLPRAQLVIANLLIEYIGCDVFRNAVTAAGADYVSCMIQINDETSEEWVSDSPYLHVFDDLDLVYHHIDEPSITAALAKADYHLLDMTEYPLPNGKKLQRLDYRRAER